MQCSQECVLKEIQRLNHDLDANREKIRYADELRAIDERTLNTFKNKFQELNKILADVKRKETNTFHIVQVCVGALRILSGRSRERLSLKRAQAIFECTEQEVLLGTLSGDSRRHCSFTTQSKCLDL